MSHQDNRQNASRLFATAAELGVPPVPFHDGDLSRIEVTYPETMDEYDRLHAEREAERQAKRQTMQAIRSDMARMGAL